MSDADTTVPLDRKKMTQEPPGNDAAPEASTLTASSTPDNSPMPPLSPIPTIPRDTDTQTSFTSTLDNAIVVIDQKFSDLVILCDGHRFNVHRWNLAKASEVLAREIENERFKEHRGVIHHDVYDAGAMERMIRFIYDGDYGVRHIQDEDKVVRHDEGSTDPEAKVVEDGTTEGIGILDGSTTPAMDTLYAHVQVHGIASYYNIQALAELAATKFRQTIQDAPWPQPGFVEVLQAIYGQAKSEEKGLRAAVVEASLQHTESINQSAPFDRAFNGGATAELGEFSAELAVALSRELRLSRRDLETEKGSTQLATEALNHLDEEMERIVKIVNDKKACRHCEVEFGETLERWAGAGSWMVRCGKCRTKHF